MIVSSPVLLVGPAMRNGIPVPKDIRNYDAVEYAHWHLLNRVLLNKHLEPFSRIEDVASNIAWIPYDNIHKYKPSDIPL